MERAWCNHLHAVFAEHVEWDTLRNDLFAVFERVEDGEYLHVVAGVDVSPEKLEVERILGDLVSRANILGQRMLLK